MKENTVLLNSRLGILWGICLKIHVFKLLLIRENSFVRNM